MLVKRGENTTGLSITRAIMPRPSHDSAIPHGIPTADDTVLVIIASVISIRTACRRV